MRAVFDTNIVIDALKGVSEADEEYRHYERVFISRITWMEVLVGADLRDFLATRFDILPLELAVAESAVAIRRTHRIRLPDAIILATAQVYDALLVTRNTKDFNPTWGGIRVPYVI